MMDTFKLALRSILKGVALIIVLAFRIVLLVLRKGEATAERTVSWTDTVQ